MPEIEKQDGNYNRLLEDQEMINQETKEGGDKETQSAPVAPVVNTRSVEDALFVIQTKCEQLPFTRPDPTKPEGYADHLSGNWDDVPAWAIRRINFLEGIIEFNERSRCPRMDNLCPSHTDLSCSAVKHCYPYLCDGSCGHDEIYVSEREKQILQKAEVAQTFGVDGIW